jgi:hypothetical protein
MSTRKDFVTATPARTLFWTSMPTEHIPVTRNRLFTERHHLLDTIEAIAPAPELCSGWGYEHTKAPASASLYGLLSGFAFSISFVVSPIL